MDLIQDQVFQQFQFKDPLATYYDRDKYQVTKVKILLQ